MANQDTTDDRQDRRLRAGRPELPLDPLDGPLSRFAHELRQLRAAAGYPSYRVLAKTAFYSASALSTAASGAAFPSLAITLAYAGACGADPAEWRGRWEAAAGLIRQAGAVGRGPGPAVPPAGRDGPDGPGCHGASTGMIRSWKHRCLRWTSPAVPAGCTAAVRRSSTAASG